MGFMHSPTTSEFTKGLDDYQRFRAKHQHLFGVTDDGAIEKGVGHVHAAFTTLKPEGVEGSVAMLNAEMLKRVPNRAASRALWRIGQPYHPAPVHALEIGQSGGGGGGFPPFAGRRDPWTHHSLSLAIKIWQRTTPIKVWVNAILTGSLRACSPHDKCKLP